MSGKFVLILADPIDDPIHSNQNVFIVKDRPEFQKGKINLPGGKIEEGESPIDAAIRELKEETGLSPINDYPSIVVGNVFGEWGTIHCVWVPVEWATLQPRAGETEKVFWASWSSLVKNSSLMPNLRLIVPLMKGGVVDWKIEDDKSSFDKIEHTISVTLRLK